MHHARPLLFNFFHGLGPGKISQCCVARIFAWLLGHGCYAIRKTGDSGMLLHLTWYTYNQRWYLVFIKQHICIVRKDIAIAFPAAKRKCSCT